MIFSSDDSHRDAIILVRETDLERTKNGFERVDECTLFSLQCMHIEVRYWSTVGLVDSYDKMGYGRGIN